MAEDCSYDENDDLETFISETDDWIDDLMKSVGWTKERVLQPEKRMVCPNNKEHTVLLKNLDEHLSYCPVLCKGYTRKEIDADQSSKFFYEKAPAVHSIDLDEATLHAILANAGGNVPADLPATMAKAEVKFNASQKLRIYEYCIEVARAANAATHIADEELALLEDKRADKPLSKLEMMAKMRDLKRRRQSYRGKNTHTSKKNHTEVIRDVLNNQMELLASIWADEAKEKEERKRQEEAVKKAQEKHEKSSNRHRKRSRSRSSSHHSRSESCSRTGHRHHGDSRHSDGSRLLKSARHHRRHDDREEEDVEEWRDGRVHKSSSRHRKHSRSRSHSRSRNKHSKRHRHEGPDAADPVEDLNRSTAAASNNRPTTDSDPCVCPSSSSVIIADHRTVTVHTAQVKTENCS